ncbi:MAG: hemerythrin domain-containing protein [Bdellovibrionaceae bacterium]|nr:hemerythrin domain-containing protein [Bdellovibrionales bacterium]MCB9083804.1 hemerythrin domain-containing protein [Pseudobdellovibrionaceae bacterium]
MNQISDFLTGDHRECDDLFAKAESVVSKGLWDEARMEMEKFTNMFFRHLNMEEEVLFPILEDKMGGPVGPTMVMRSEHQQMRGLVEEMGLAVQDQDQSAFLSASETLMILIQQHNMKEEQILYPMCDEALAEEGHEVIGKMQEVKM